MPPFWQSLSSRILLIVVLGAVVPLALVGVWLAENTREAGVELLRERLDDALVAGARDIGSKWVSRRSALLDIRDDATVQDALRRPSSATHIPLPGLANAAARLRNVAQLVFIRDADDNARWLVANDNTGEPALVPAADSLLVGGTASSGVLRVEYPVREAGNVIGSIDARLRAEALMPGSGAAISRAGAVVGIVDRSTGAAIVPMPFDPELLLHDQFAWGNERWLTASRAVEEPYIRLLAAAPVTSFTVPFAQSSRQGLLALGFVTALCFLLTVVLTRRTTRSLVTLTKGAEAVAAGDLERTVQIRSRDEVGRLAHSFNTMTESLRRTLGQLSEREAVTAVGEFAAALAHEIRNPLSAIRLNLQRAQEHASSAVEAPIAQSLRDIARLENTLAGALRVARTGRMRMEPVGMAGVLDAAIRNARPQLSGRTLDFTPPADIEIRGNAASLEQLFLNLLLNAAHATSAGDTITIETRARSDGLVISVHDNGEGIPEDVQARVFDPFFSTRPEGTGLGLAVAKRIVKAHGGDITLQSEPGRGTRIEVRLPYSNSVVHAT